MPTTNLDACVIGGGYIGLPTAAMAAQAGLKIKLVDIDQRIVDTINNGDIHIVEPGLVDIVRSTVETSHLSAVSAVPDGAPLYIICVPTPLIKDGPILQYKADLSYVFSVVESLASVLRGNEVILLESTSPVGTTNRIKKLLDNLRPELQNIQVAYCPERVLPGKILTELVLNDRIVGCENEATFNVVRNFYGNFVKGKIFSTSLETAEMVKLAENTFRDINIAIANEFSMMCDQAGINVNEMINLANLHPRVDILKPGIGVGGHCLAVDPWFLVEQFNGCAELTEAARNVNLRKTDWCIRKIEERLDELNLRRKCKVGLYGASYKPDVDDFRESPSVTLAEGLLETDNLIYFIEPNGTVKGFTNISFNDALSQCDLIVLLVAHSELKNKHLELVRNSQKIMDLTGVLF